MNSPRQTPPLFGSPDARLTAWLCLAALLLAAVAVNMRVLDFGFLYLRDDDVNITLNPHMGGLGAARLHWMFTDWSYVRRYIPLGWLGFSATYEFAGLDPAPYHAVALGLYVLNCGLVFALLLSFMRRLAPAGREGGLTPWEAVAAALGAGWWALHPLRVETTAWVSGNLYGQALALLLAALLAYLRTYSSSGRPHGRRGSPCPRAPTAPRSSPTPWRSACRSSSSAWTGSMRRRPPDPRSDGSSPRRRRSLSPSLRFSR